LRTRPQKAWTARIRRDCGWRERIPPRIIRPTIFFGRTPPKRRWIVPDWIPYGAVTGLYGQGAVKALNALKKRRLAAAVQK
jgi:hypothetical protein